MLLLEPEIQPSASAGDAAAGTVSTSTRENSKGLWAHAAAATALGVAVAAAAAAADAAAGRGVVNGRRIAQETLWILHLHPKLRKQAAGCLEAAAAAGAAVAAVAAAASIGSRLEDRGNGGVGSGHQLRGRQQQQQYACVSPFAAAAAAPASSVAAEEHPRALGAARQATRSRRNSNSQSSNSNRSSSTTRSKRHSMVSFFDCTYKPIAFQNGLDGVSSVSAAACFVARYLPSTVSMCSSRSFAPFDSLCSSRHSSSSRSCATIDRNNCSTYARCSSSDSIGITDERIRNGSESSNTSGISSLHRVHSSSSNDSNSSSSISSYTSINDSGSNSNSNSNSSTNSSSSKLGGLFGNEIFWGAQIRQGNLSRKIPFKVHRTGLQRHQQRHQQFRLRNCSSISNASGNKGATSSSSRGSRKKEIQQQFEK
ncbi:hypothetical protein, conserved [Eimeria maxima]|uniref:Uncharacterized protein n=1 Tax=Eimeria maxima TaxID=5804 RepID=U6MEY6_EIMMA|nr:hypothetical protein, conserved [Eimeria maxima]CDJ61608.1 hypothetical protein, conserved [Eimeria maxima]